MDLIYANSKDLTQSGLMYIRVSSLFLVSFRHISVLLKKPTCIQYQIYILLFIFARRHNSYNFLSDRLQSRNFVFWAEIWEIQAYWRKHLISCPAWHKTVLKCTHLCLQNHCRRKEPLGWKVVNTQTHKTWPHTEIHALLQTQTQSFHHQLIHTKKNYHPPSRQLHVQS